ncbi:MAG: MFS transporter [Propionibacteriales bacterium]|nr:MFS transporter [Propionibacteriales bacterium]
MTADPEDTPESRDRAAMVLLALAALAVAFSAADTYVVVLALPEMMAGVGLSAEDLQRAAPILSGFMLGYVAALPLVGRIADLRGRAPVLIGSLIVFAIGSLVTAAAYDLPSMVTGRVLQGVGGGGLLPATLSLVADMYPPQKRGIPLGVVGAVQEFGNVVGPLYGAVVLAFGTWRDIFWINLAVGLVLAAVIRQRTRDRGLLAERPTSRLDLLSVLLALGLVTTVLLVMRAPRSLTDDVTAGLAFLPVFGGSRWFSPLGLTAAILLVLLVLRGLTASAPLLDLRSWRTVLTQIDVLGSVLLTLALSGVILAFATADPAVQVFAPEGPWLIAGSAVAAAAFWQRNRTAPHPLVPPASLAATPAWGALVVSFFVGAALIAALVDIPIFARITVYSDSQVAAALVLVRFLVGLPIGAFLGGWWTHHAPAGVVTAAGMAIAGSGFGWMTQWGLESLRDPISTVPLLLAGIGIGLAMAPVNAALLASTDNAVHGVTSALLVVARTVGKLVGISALTTIGLRRYYAEQADMPGPQEICPGGRSRCAEFSLLLRESGLIQLHTIFLGAAICCAIAGLVALVVFRGAQTREVKTAVFGADLG